jgi:hypothetical protein
MDILTFTTGTFRLYQAMALNQRAGMREQGYTGEWRVLTDKPELFGADGIKIAADRSRTVNRREKTKLPQHMDLSRYDRVIFMEADMKPGPGLQRILDDLPSDAVAVQRGPCSLNKFRSNLPNIAAPWNSFVSIPRKFVSIFFRLLVAAHSNARLGYEEVVLFEALDALRTLHGGRWTYAEGLSFWPEISGLTHHNGLEAKAHISPAIAQIIADQDEHFFNAPLSEISLPTP